MAVKKQMYAEWRRNMVTQELMQELRESVEGLVAQMVNRDIPDTGKDQFCRAFVRVADSVISWQPEFLKEEDEEESIND